MDITPLTNEELGQLLLDVLSEQERRRKLASIPQAIADLNASFLAAEGTESGQEWRQPTGAHDAYPLDWEVTHNGKTWVSLTPANVWEPGVSSWREVVPENEAPPEWVQPTGSQDAYNIGDQVTFEGQVWESTINANVWSPTGYPQGWVLVP